MAIMNAECCRAHVYGSQSATWSCSSDPSLLSACKHCGYHQEVPVSAIIQSEECESIKCRFLSSDSCDSNVSHDSADSPDSIDTTSIVWEGDDYPSWGPYISSLEIVSKGKINSVRFYESRKSFRWRLRPIWRKRLLRLPRHILDSDDFSRPEGHG